jgi:hypothetical protein
VAAISGTLTGKEDKINKVQDVTINPTSQTDYPSVNAIVSYINSKIFIWY